MECKDFDDVLIDLLYEEERPRPLGVEEARRHAEGCAKCGPALANLRQARGLAEVPMLAVPGGLEERILAAAAPHHVKPPTSPWQQFDRFVSRAGSYAMRPQLAMGALLMLMVGTSLLLLRARPAGPGAVRITEDGVPAAAPAAAPVPAQAAASLDRRSAPDAHGTHRDDDRPSARPEAMAKADGPAGGVPGGSGPADKSKDSAPTATASATAEAAPAASAGPPQDAQYTAAMDDFRAKRFSDAVRGFDIVAGGGGANAPQAALYAARATRYSSGCGAALPRFDGVASQYAGTSTATEASWESATCYREVGQIDRARQLFQSMRHVAGYGDRAKSELAALDAQASKAPAAAPPPAAAAKPAGGKADAASKASY